MAIQYKHSCQVALRCLISLLSLSLSTEMWPLDKTQFGDSFDISTLRTQFGDVLDHYPDHPRSSDLLAFVQNTAENSYSMSPNDLEIMLLTHFANHNLGKEIFDDILYSHHAHSHLESIEYCERIRRVYPRTAVGLHALLRELDLKCRDNPMAFLQTCGDILTKSLPAITHSFVLIKLAGYCALNEQSKRAALEYLRAIVLYPQHLNNPRIVHRVRTCLEKAGLFYESSLLFNSDASLRETGLLLQDLSRASDGVAVNSDRDSSRSVAERYFLYSPDITKVLGPSPYISPPHSTSILNLARLVCLYASLDQDAGALETYGHFSDAVHAVIQSDPELEHLFTLSATNSAIIACARNVYDRRVMDSILFTTPTPDLLNNDPLLKNATDLQLTILESRLTTALECSDSGTVKLTTGKMADIRHQRSDQQGVSDIYRSTINALTGLDNVSDLYITLADYYHEQCNLPGKAAEICEEYTRRFPDCSRGEEFILKTGLLLKEANRYQEAIATLNPWIDKYPGSTLMPEALYVVAICEARLGNRGRSEVLMSRIATGPHNSNYEPHAILWLALNELSKQNYSMTGMYLEEIMTGYRDSQWSQQAGELLRRLRGITSQR